MGNALKIIENLVNYMTAYGVQVPQDIKEQIVELLESVGV